jgi:hypothetical protein
MDDILERLVYGVLSGIIGALIAMSILFWTDGEYQLKFFVLFMAPSFVLGLFVGKRFLESVWVIFRAIW